MEPLTAPQLRVLGCLIEKDLATPEYYPLSLNALTMACNQKTNRDPVTAYDEREVRNALESLSFKDLVEDEPGSRVVKYRHCLGQKLNLSRPELALLTVLMLRGPQTPGELRQRTSSMHSFDDTEAVLSSLRRMDAGLVLELVKQPGWKEPRWTQLLGGPVDASAAVAGSVESHREPLADRVQRLEAELAQLRQEFEELRRQLE